MLVQDKANVVGSDRLYIVGRNTFYYSDSPLIFLLSTFTLKADTNSLIASTTIQNLPNDPRSTITPLPILALSIGWIHFFPHVFTVFPTSSRAKDKVLWVELLFLCPTLDSIIS